MPNMTPRDHAARAADDCEARAVLAPWAALRDELTERAAGLRAFIADYDARADVADLMRRCETEAAEMRAEVVG